MVITMIFERLSKRLWLDGVVARPSRYLILMMRALGLLGELNKASAKEEAAVLGARRMDAILLPNKDQLSADAQSLSFS